MQGITETERQVYDHWRRTFFGDMPNLVNRDPTGDDIRYIRKLMWRTAYHEAGHYVLGLCFAFEAEIDYVTILPMRDCMGRECMGCVMPYESNHHLAVHAPHIFGHAQVLHRLAGPIAESVYENGPAQAREGLLLELEIGVGDAEGDEGDDYSVAMSIAEAMADSSAPNWPAWRYLKMLSAWAWEAVTTPPVWECIDALAKALYQQGKIPGHDALDLLSRVNGMTHWCRLPTAKRRRWKRRLVRFKLPSASV